jgi:hypothetical protein
MPSPRQQQQQQRQYRLFTFDLETTGLSQEYDAIIEMAAVDVASGSSWSSLVCPAPYKKSAQKAFGAHGGLKHRGCLDASSCLLNAGWCARLMSVLTQAK